MWLTILQVFHFHKCRHQVLHYIKSITYNTKAIINTLKSLFLQILATGFCDYNITASPDYGNHIWPESVGNSTLVFPCSNRPGMNVTRECQTNGGGWSNPDYSQCVVSK